MRQIVIFLLLFMLFSCSSRKYVDEDKYPTIFYDESKSDEMLKTILENISDNSYVAVKKYKEKHYLYVPCEMMEYCQLDISKDSVKLIFGEGDVMKIESMESEIGGKRYQLSSRFTSATLELKKINAQKEIYAGKFVWDTTGNISYYLFAKGEEIKQYPVIVNACTTEKVNELKFEEEDLRTYFE